MGLIEIRSRVQEITEKVFGGQPVHEHVTVSSAGTAEQLPSNSVPKGAQVAIKALDNQGTVYVGGSTVDSSNGFPLSSGNTLTYSVSDTSLVYVDADNSGDGIAFTVESDA